MWGPYWICFVYYYWDEHRWCEDPIESALFIIILIIYIIFQLNRIFEGLNMLESHETLHTHQKWRKFTSDMGFKRGCGKMARQRHLYTSTVCASSYVSRTWWKSVHSCNITILQKSLEANPKPNRKLVILINSSNFVSFWGFQVSYFNKLLLEIYSDDHQIWSV